MLSCKQGMILSYILGGLGNQMFQYAAGRALSLARGEPLRLDVSDFTHYNLHQGFELDQVFNSTLALAKQDDVQSVLGWQSSRLIRLVLSRSEFRALRCRSLVVEPYFQYWPEITTIKSPCYLVGYWQSERYFENVSEIIRNDFTFRQPLNGLNDAIADQIDGVNAVSLHVRRGDYVNNPKAFHTHGLCSQSYYEAAIRYIEERVANPYFFVFSDDMQWVQENIKIAHPCRYIDHNQGKESYNDMRLMSLCQHNITANSSFSWWGAWLNSHTDKIVVAPQKWFANNNSVKDLFPAGWVVL